MKTDDWMKPITKEEYLDFAEKQFHALMKCNIDSEYYEFIVWESDIVQKYLKEKWADLNSKKPATKFDLFMSTIFDQSWAFNYLVCQYRMNGQDISYHKIGEFSVTSGKLQVTDPCYGLDTWCAGNIEVKNGTYTVYAQMLSNKITGWGIRNGQLIIVHNDHLDIDYKNCINELTSIHVGVDSGQAGYFDYEYFGIAKAEENKEEAFYSSVCTLTLDTPLSAGVIPRGTCSSSGFGDGGYNCFVYKVNDVIVASRIEFINPDEEDESDDDELSEM